MMYPLEKREDPHSKNSHLKGDGVVCPPGRQFSALHQAKSVLAPGEVPNGGGGHVEVAVNHLASPIMKGMLAGLRPEPAAAGYPPGKQGGHAWWTSQFTCLDQQRIPVHAGGVGGPHRSSIHATEAYFMDESLSRQCPCPEKGKSTDSGVRRPRQGRCIFSEPRNAGTGQS